MKVRLKTLEELGNEDFSISPESHGRDWYRIADKNSDRYQSYQASWFGKVYETTQVGSSFVVVSTNDPDYRSFNITKEHCNEVEDYYLPEELFKIWG